MSRTRRQTDGQLEFSFMTTGTSSLLERQTNVSPLTTISKKYSVILADPPWRYQKGTTTPTRAIERQYETMSLEEIMALPVQDLAEPGAVLFLWATVPQLPAALKVMEGWGFEYKSHYVWKKNNFGLGHWVRVCHELLLIGRSGKQRPPDKKRSPLNGSEKTTTVHEEWRCPHCWASMEPTVIPAKNRGHSIKPDEFYELIEQMFPDAERIELFARGRREGWDVWGNQVPEEKTDG